MAEPNADRPHMPGYGTLPADEGGGLLPWSWAADKLAESHDYWVATVDADGAPALSPVWGLWMDGQVWFSCGRRSRKARNLERDARVSVANDHPGEQVVVEGTTERITDLTAIERFLTASNAKYEQSYELDFLDPEVNGTYAVTPIRVIGLKDAEFEGSPTRWRF